ncbi:MAG: hypothetical protein JSU96_03995 [Acidobacteriota bacterium]|nr:MAG: hypothetical protein JSU96_03995 [Acidobacteriota bacterium]
MNENIRPVESKTLLAFLGVLATLVLLSPLLKPVQAQTSPERSFVQTPYPRIAMLWAPVRGDRSIASMARHDLIMAGSGSFGLVYDGKPTGEADGFTDQSESIARDRIAEIRRINPDAVIIGDLLFYEYPDDWLPEDHPWWLRRDGERQQFWPGTHRMDWNRTDYRAHVVKQTVALQKIGFDGVFYDNVRNEPEPWTAFLTEIRKEVGNDFLLFLNVGYAIGEYDFVAPFVNGIMYESGWSHDRTEWETAVQEMQHTQSLLMEPRISLIERFEEIRSHAGWPGDPQRGQKPPDDPQARRWSLAFSLAIGDFYYLFSDNTSHRHDWYPEYDEKIGLPVGPSTRLNPFVWSRKYERALVVVNLPGSPESYEIELAGNARNSLTGKTGNRFSVPSGDGAILIVE